MFLVNSRLGLFTAALFPGHPFFRSYGVILPSSLTIVLSLTLGFSPHLPVSVCGTGTWVSLAAFLDSVKSAASSHTATPSQPSLKVRGFAYAQASLLGHTRPTVCSAYPSVSPLRSNDFRWYRNINLLSIAYAFRPRLRPRLTLRGRTFLRKP